MRAPRLAALAVFLFLAGCNHFNKSDPDAPLVADSHSPITDVPIPAGFTMTGDSTSKVVPGDQIRFVDHHYKGNDDQLPVINFYREQMPGQGWTWIDQNQPPGKDVTLHFTKKNEDCFITVSKGTFDTHIRIKIDPVGRNTGNQ
jgi:hypothetical protein